MRFETYRAQLVLDAAVTPRFTTTRSGFPFRFRSENHPGLAMSGTLREFLLIARPPLLAVMQGGEYAQLPAFAQSSRTGLLRQSLTIASLPRLPERERVPQKHSHLSIQVGGNSRGMNGRGETMKMRILLTILVICGTAVALTTTTAQTPAASVPEKALLDDLVLANRMLASQELGVLDAFGHVSVRSRTNPNRFYISRYVAPGIVTAADIIENDLDSKPVNGQRNDQYQERFLHGEIYKARPDVMAIVHSHTAELVAFGVSSVPLRTGDDEQVPVYDIRKFNNGRSGILDTPELARSMAQTLGKKNSILLLGHGAVVVSSSVYGVVSGA